MVPDLKLLVSSIYRGHLRGKHGLLKRGSARVQVLGRSNWSTMPPGYMVHIRDQLKLTIYLKWPYNRKNFRMLQNLNLWELSLKIWAGGSLDIPLWWPKTILWYLSRFLRKFSQEGCQTVRYGHWFYHFYTRKRLENWPYIRNLTICPKHLIVWNPIPFGTIQKLTI